jgi:hypothetical protein
MPEGTCPVGSECRLGTCVELEGSADIPALGTNLGAIAHIVRLPTGTERVVVTVIEGAACRSLPPEDRAILSVDAERGVPLGTDVSTGGPYFVSGSYTPRGAASNELATTLTLRFDQLDGVEGGTVAGSVDAIFPSATLAGTFDATLCMVP